MRSTSTALNNPIWFDFDCPVFRQALKFVCFMPLRLIVVLDQLGGYEMLKSFLKAGAVFFLVSVLAVSAGCGGGGGGSSGSSSSTGISGSGK